MTYAALYLLRRLKTRFPAARGSSGHRLFISAFMLASKVICDDTYSNKSWSIVGQGMFALREINQMEREMCTYLEWQLNVEPNALKEFEYKVKRDFKGPRPYPSYLMPSSTPLVFGTPTPAPSTSQSMPSVRSGSAAQKSSYLPPPVSPSVLGTSEASHSPAASPAPSVRPSMPQGQIDNGVRIASPDSVLIATDHRCYTLSMHMRAHMYPQSLSRMSKDAVSSSRQSKCNLFAYAAPVAW